MHRFCRISTAIARRMQSLELLMEGLALSGGR